jgi:nitroreductase
MPPLNDRSDPLAFLLSRRSRPAKTLATPGPDRATLETLLTAAARVPDHGKLTPWRFIVAEGPARARVGRVAAARGEALGMEPDKIEKAARAFEQGALFVAVVAAPHPSEKIPEWEQLLSAGCACFALVNAALASGWGANWLTGFTATDRPFLEEAFGLSAPDFVVGYVHIGTPTVDANERTRPALHDVTTWLEA